MSDDFDLALKAFLKEVKNTHDSQKAKDRFTWANKGPLASSFFKLCDAAAASGDLEKTDDSRRKFATELEGNIADVIGKDVLPSAKLVVKIKDWEFGGPRYSSPRATQSPAAGDDGEPATQAPTQSRRASTRRSSTGGKKRGKKRGPRKPMSAFMYFSKEVHESGTLSKDLTFAERSKLVAERWAHVPQTERKKYQVLAEQDKERYQKELDEASDKETDSDDISLPPPDPKRQRKSSSEKKQKKKDRKKKRRDDSSGASDLDDHIGLTQTKDKDKDKAKEGKAAGKEDRKDESEDDKPIKPKVKRGRPAKPKPKPAAEESDDDDDDAAAAAKAKEQAKEQEQERAAAADEAVPLGQRGSASPSPSPARPATAQRAEDEQDADGPPAPVASRASRSKSRSPSPRRSASPPTKPVAKRGAKRPANEMESPERSPPAADNDDQPRKRFTRSQLVAQVAGTRSESPKPKPKAKRTRGQ